MVRLGFGYTNFKIRMASIIVSVPVPLSVAPCAASQESKCADSITYSSGFSVPLISAMVLNEGTIPKSFEPVSILIIGLSPDSTKRYKVP